MDVGCCGSYIALEFDWPFTISPSLSRREVVARHQRRITIIENPLMGVTGLYLTKSGTEGGVSLLASSCIFEIWSVV